MSLVTDEVGVADHVRIGGTWYEVSLLRQDGHQFRTTRNVLAIRSLRDVDLTEKGEVFYVSAGEAAAARETFLEGTIELDQADRDALSGSWPLAKRFGSLSQVAALVDQCLEGAEEPLADWMRAMLLKPR